MNLFCIMLVNNKYMSIFPTSFAFFFWNKTLSNCRVFLFSFLAEFFKQEKKIFKKTQGMFLFYPHVSSSLGRVISSCLSGLTEGGASAVVTG